MSSVESSADKPATAGQQSGVQQSTRGSCTVLVPAYNEAETISSVVHTARRSELGDVLVVDDGSTDDTAERARAAGATVLSLSRNRGKGGAVAAGLTLVETDVVLLIDADLVGITPQHLYKLAAPVTQGEVEMTRGVFSGGRWSTTAAQKLTPQLTGQRAVRTQLLREVSGLARSRYGIEVAITEHAREAGWRIADVPLEGVSQVMKEEKQGVLAGLFARLRMYGDIVRTLVRSRKE